MKVAGKSDVGLVRPNNEDAFGVWPHQGLLIVADGMGGHEAGEVASHQAVETIRRELTAEHSADESPRERLRQAVERANSEILELARVRGNNMGTTVTVAQLDGGRIHVAQVGDSRAYLLRAGALMQLTQDHSLVQELVTAGVLSPESAQFHPARNMLTRALGQVPGLQVDVVTRTVQAGDVLLLCSDGLTAMLTDDEIRDLLEANPRPRRAVTELVARANAQGGVDNITVVVAVDLMEAPRRRPPTTPLLSALTVLLALTGGAYVLFGHTLFLAPQGDRVALWRGLPVRVGEHRLARVVETLPVRVESLTRPYADRIRKGLLVPSPAAARRLVHEMSAETPDLNAT